jgi:hypothetical protein
VPFAASSGAARRAFERMTADVSLRGWMPEAIFTALRCCASASEYAVALEQVLQI